MDQIVQSCDIEVLNNLGNKISSFLLQNWAIIATVIIYKKEETYFRIQTCFELCGTIERLLDFSILLPYI